jgi:PAS domain S-box-containing protein
MADPDHMAKQSVSEALSERLVQHVLLCEAIEEADMLVFVADEAMRYIAVNERTCQLLGYTREELLGLRVTDIAVAEDAQLRYREMVRLGEQRGVTGLRAKDGTILPFRYSARMTRVAGLPYYVAVGTVELDAALS